MIRRAFLSLLLSGILAFGLTITPVQADETTLADLTARAQAGETPAQTALAFAYHQGETVAQNYATAALWATRAAEAGDPKAQHLLGRYYHVGLGVAQNQAEALRWLRAAATGGDPQYLHDLGTVLENGADGTADPAAAARAYAQAAQAGHIEAIVSLGLLYQAGTGVEMDFTRARQLYEQAAIEGHARAQNNLGLLYVRGNGVAQDYEKAAQLFTAAAESGLPDAIRNLGVMYENGFGVPLDEELAIALYRRAGQVPSEANALPALQYDPRLMPLPQEEGLQARLRQGADAGDPVAQFQLAWSLISTSDPDFAAQAEAAALFKAAAKAGYGPAMRNLGLLYFEGRAVPQDYVLGRMWLTLAAQAGQTGTSELIETLGSTMTSEQINEAQARAAAQK